MKRALAALALLTLSTPAMAQRGQACVAPAALQIRAITVVPEAGLFAYRLQILNAGPTRRNFSYHFPLEGLTPPPGAVYAFNIQPQQSITIPLGTTPERATERALRAALRITCHS